MATIYSEDYQLIIRILREARIAQEITQEQLATAVGRPQSFIAKVENGERRIDVVEFVHLARLLGVDPAEVLSKIVRTLQPIK